MKQQILIPSGQWSLENKYEMVTPQVAYQPTYLRGYTITPKQDNVFKKLCSENNKSIVFNFDDKKDPRRSISTKNSNSILFCFNTIFENKECKSDLTINQNQFSQTTIDLMLNQFLLESANQNQNNLTLTFNGALGRIIIDRSNPFKKIIINNNNKTELYDNNNKYFTRYNRISITDNKLEELIITNADEIIPNKQSSINLDALRSYSLKKIKLKGYKLDISNNTNRFILKNTEIIDLTGIQKFDFRYNNFFRTLAKDSAEFEKNFNPNMIIKLNPESKCCLHHTSTNKAWVSKKEGYEPDPITIKEAFGLKSNEIFECKLIDIINRIKKQEEKRFKEENKNLTKLNNYTR